MALQTLVNQPLKDIAVGLTANISFLAAVYVFAFLLQENGSAETGKSSDRPKSATVAKLSDIVRNNIPSSAANAVIKGKSASSTTTHTAPNSHNKDTHNDKPAAKSHAGGHKSHHAQNNIRSTQHGRPTHLTNGVVNHDAKGKPLHKPHMSKPSASSKSEGATGDKTATSADKIASAENAKSTPDKLSPAGVPKPTNSANANQTSPTVSISLILIGYLLDKAVCNARYQLHLCSVVLLGCWPRFFVEARILWWDL